MKLVSVGLAPPIPFAERISVGQAPPYTRPIRLEREMRPEYHDFPC